MIVAPAAFEASTAATVWPPASPARGRQARGGARRLLLALDRARPRDQRERLAPDRGRSHLDGGGLGMEVPRDHLVGLADPDDVIDALHLLPIDRLEARRVADEAGGRAHGAARNEALTFGPAHPFGDGFDVRLRRALLHHDDHPRPPPAPERPRGRNGPGPPAPGPLGSFGGRWLPRAAPEGEVPLAEEPLHEGLMVTADRRRCQQSPPQRGGAGGDRSGPRG